MKLLLANYFFILALIQAGLLIGIYQLYRVKKTVKPSRFWLWSLFFNIAALCLFGIGILSVEDISKPRFNFTIANSLFFAAAISQALFCRSLNKQITKSEIIFSCVAFFSFLIIFEVLRNIGTFELRTTFNASLTSLLYVWQIFEVKKRRKEYPSVELQFLQYTEAAELLLNCVRLVLMSISTFTIRDVSQIPEVLILVTIALLVMNTLSYIYIAAYWTDLIASSAARAQVETKRIAALLEERDLLIGTLLKANKTVATGALSASIAHELNQPLTATGLNIQFLQKKLADGSLSPEIQKSIYDALLLDNQRSAEIIRSLKDIFSDKDTPEEKVNIAEVLSSIIKLSETELLDKKIQIHQHLEKNLFVYASHSEIHQVLLNLLNNSVEALSSTSQSAKVISVYGRLTSDGVQITVADNGKGIPLNQQRKLFDLLVSNSPKGMGLGLWLCKYIVSRHGGNIWYEDGVEGGAQFHFVLPKRG